MENRVYTGYKDGKGKKIYVGDRVISLNSGREYIAIYDIVSDKYCLSTPSEKVILSFDCFKQDWLEKIKEQTNGK